MVDAALVVVTPLLVQRIVDDGILQGDVGLVALLAPADGRSSRSSTRCSAVGAGYLSSRIGEGLIHDLRTAVFGHVQRLSLAFFTRTQTGALVSRLNNDVIGAQRAFTSTLSSTVSNSIAVVVVGHRDARAELAGHAAVPAALPAALPRSPAGSAAELAGLTREQMDGNAAMGNAMTERFNVGGAMLLKLFGRRDEEDAQFADKAAIVRDLGVRIALITRIFARHADAGPGAGHRAGLRRRRLPRRSRASSASAPCWPSPRCCCGCSARCRASPTSAST